MKRVLSLVLVLVMVLGAIVPAFAETAVTTAAEMTAGEKLEAYNVIDGTDKGLEEDQPLTRAAMAVVIAQMYGEKEIAMDYAFEPTFTDMEEGAWYIPYVAYAENKGWMVGGGAGTTFRPNDVMTAQEVNAMFLKALGYTVEWADVNTEAEAMGFGVVAADATLVLRGEAFAAVVAALDVMPKDGTETLGTVLALEGYTAPVTPSVALEVVSVSADNHKEIVVVFNNELDADTVVAANFTIDGGAATTVALADDNKTVTVTLDDADATAAQPLDVTLTVADVMDVNESEVVEADYELSVIDSTRPVAQSVALTGPQQFEITFSEPVKTAPTVKVNNGVYGSTVGAADGTNKITVTLGAELADGDYTVDVTSFTDYADIAGPAAELTLTYAADATAPLATVKSATQTSVVIEFDKDVVLDNTNAYVDYFYHTFNAWAPDSVSMSGNTYTLTFTTYPLPEGTNKVVVTVSGDAADSEIVDLWGNEMAANLEFMVEVSADVTAPEVVSVEQDTEDVVIVTFSEEIDATIANTEANYVVKDSDGEEIDTALNTAVLSQNADDEWIVTLTFAAKLTGGEYTVTISNMEDEALEANELAETAYAFTITDVTAITAAATVVEFVDGIDNEFVYVAFPEAMNSDDVLDAGNYLLALDGTTFAALHDDATLAMFGTDNTTVKITLPAGTALVDGTSVLMIGRVEDAAGNAITELSYNETIAEVDGSTVTVTAEVTEANKITITVDEELTAVTTAAFTTSSGALAAINSWTVDDGETTIMVTVDAADAADAADTSDAAILGGLSVVASELETTKGVVVDAGAVVLTDGRTPEVLTAVDAANEITLDFSEAVQAVATGAAMANDFVVKDADGDTLVAFIDYTTAIVGGDVVITVTGVATVVDYTVETVAAPAYVEDAADNLIEAFDAITIE